MKLLREIKWNHGEGGIRLHLRVAVVIVTIALHLVSGIRVYDDTNFPEVINKPQKISSFSKKPVYITKRSWNPPVDNLKLGTKLERRSNGKWKDVNKNKVEENEVPILYKIKFNDKKVLQYLKYIKEIPRLEEFTFCLWYKPTNLSHDHTLFSYSLNKNENLLKFWINSYDSTLRLAIRDIPAYKVPANIREFKWHHICQSWDGVPGEWQVFLDGKRISSGVLSHYKETYIPEGGEIVLGQELLDVEKGLNNNLEGEVFGFNLVDQAVPGEQANFINSQYKPSVRVAVPPFKKLPPIKKTYQEIKAYISKLPPDPNELRRFEPKQFQGDVQNINQRTKNISVAKRNRGSHRAHHSPLRKVVIYNRDDRQLPLDEAEIKINKTKATISSRPRTLTESKRSNFGGEEGKIKSHHFDENYSIHSYRIGKDDKKNSKYEIYEALEEDAVKSLEKDKLTQQETMESQARGNFNLFTAREANKVYTMSNSVKDLRKPKFHFETTSLEDNIRKSIVAEESKSTGVRTPVKTERKFTDSIPVHETETLLGRQKRQTDSEQRESRKLIADDILKTENGFRRLPQIPDSFINAFTKNASKTELERTLNQFFVQNATKEESNVATIVTESPLVYTSVSTELGFLPEISNHPTTSPQFKENNDKSLVLNNVPVSLIPTLPRQQIDSRILTERIPITFPIVQDFDPAQRFQSENYTNWFEKSEPAASRRKFDVSAGTDLIMRAYGLCTANRGSPVEDKERLVISWADTPIRIFGGAEVEHARNKCGNF